MKKLNPRQEKFAQLYVDTGNATQSYRDAGYQPKTDRTAEVSAHNLLRNPKVEKRVEELRKKASDKSELTRDDIVRFLCDVVRTPIDEIVRTALDDGAPTSPLLQEVSSGKFGTTYKMPGKMDAIKELNRMLGNYEPEKINLSVEDELIEMIGDICGSRKE